MAKPLRSPAGSISRLLEDDNWHLAIGTALVEVVSGPGLPDATPEIGSFGPGGDTGTHGLRVSLHGDRHFRTGEDVAVPLGVSLVASVGGHENDHPVLRDRCRQHRCP